MMNCGRGNFYLQCDWWYTENAQKIKDWSRHVESLYWVNFFHFVLCPKFNSHHPRATRIFVYKLPIYKNITMQCRYHQKMTKILQNLIDHLTNLQNCKTFMGAWTQIKEIKSIFFQIFTEISNNIEIWCLQSM